MNLLRVARLGAIYQYCTEIDFIEKFKVPLKIYLCTALWQVMEIFYSNFTLRNQYATECMDIKCTDNA